MSSSIPPGVTSEAAARDVLQLSPALTAEDRRQQKIQRKQQERIVRGGAKWDRYGGRLHSAAVSIFVFASVIAVPFMVSQCFLLSRQQQKQMLQPQLLRRLAAEKGTGEEKEVGGDNNFLEHICEEERKNRENIEGNVTASSATYIESGMRLELSPFEEGKEMEEIEEDDGDDDDEPPKKKKDEEVELQKEEGIFPLTASFATEMYAPASPTAEAAAGGAAGGGAAESMRESILQYVEEILADDNGGSEAVEEDIYFSSLLSELNLMVGTQSIGEVQQQQQQRERKQQALIDQFSNAVHSVVVLPSYGGSHNRDYASGKGKELGEAKEGDVGNDESGGEGDKNVTDDRDNDDNDGNGHTDHRDDTNNDNSDGSDAGEEGAAADGDNDDGNNNDNAEDADDEYASADDDNGYADAEDNDDTAGFASAAADDVDDIGDDTEADNHEDDDDTDTADEGTSAAAFAAAAAAAVPADYDKLLEGEILMQRQQPRRKRGRTSKSSEGQTLHLSSQEEPFYSLYQVAIIVDPPGRLPVKEEEEMRERRRLKGNKELHFPKQFIFTAGNTNAKGAYSVICKEIYYEGIPSVLLYWMPFFDPSVAGRLQQLQRQQQQQQQSIDEHPFFRLPSVSPSASVRSFTRRGWSPRQMLTISELNALLAIKDVLKKQQPLTSEDLLQLLVNLEHLVECSVHQGKEVVERVRPSRAVKKLGTALLMTDAMFAAGEVLGEKAKKNEWWKDVIAALPVYRRPTAVTAARYDAQQSLMLIQLLLGSLEFYKGGQRPPPLVLVPLKQILLCTHAVPELMSGHWTRFQTDDEEWQLLEQAK